MFWICLNRKDWCRLNRFRCGFGKYNYLLNKWYISDDPLCECGENQTMNEVNDCYVNKFNRGLTGLHEVKRGALKWIQDLNVDV